MSKPAETERWKQHGKIEDGPESSASGIRSDGNRLSRREFVFTGASAVAAAGLPTLREGVEQKPEAVWRAGSRAITVDYPRLVSRADLEYRQPVTRSEEGMPVGNGRMGTLVWTSASALKLQINRPDVFAENCATNSFPERHTDYGSGCGYVDVDFGDYGPDIFGPGAFRQHLSVYDGVVSITGNGVNVRMLAWHERDVIAIEIEDQRANPAPIRVQLRMLRYLRQYLSGENYQLTSQNIVRVVNRSQTADSKLEIRNRRVVLTQQFREGSFYSASGVAIAAAGRESLAKYTSDSTVQLCAAPGKGRFVLLVGSASSFVPEPDVAALALAEIDAAEVAGFDALLTGNRAWWQDYWSRAFVHLHSQDGVADFVEENYTYFLYLMACSSRGAFPPRFGGMLWYTNGDMREWGAQHWWANTSCYYDALPPANRFEVMEPVFAMYSKMLPACSLAAQQQWGSEGIFIPETVWFDGLEQLPNDVAAEMRDLYLLRKPWEERSKVFREFADPKQPHNSRWNWKAAGKWVNGKWIYEDKGAGPYGQVTHIFSSGAKIAHLYWLRYEYTQDRNWLGDRAYPVLRGIAEFYRHFPNVKKGNDGQYHIHNVNNHEPVWGAQDTMEELSAMHGILPLVIRASELLGTDQDLRPIWREFLQNLAPLPASDSSGAAKPAQPGAPRCWISGLPPVLHGDASAYSLVPALYYDLCTSSTEDSTVVHTSNATFEAMYPHGVNGSTPVSVLNRNATAAAHLRRANDLKYMLPNQLRCLAPEHDFCDWIGGGKTGVLPNRLTLREGPGAIDAERIGRMSEALHAALLQSGPASPAGHPVIHVFPAWPKEWDGQFTLLARGAVLVTASLRRGEIEFVELLCQQGGDCFLRNPWNGREVTVYRQGQKSLAASGTLLKFDTKPGDLIHLQRAGSAHPLAFPIRVPDLERG